MKPNTPTKGELEAALAWLSDRLDILQSGVRFTVHPKPRWADGWDTNFPAHLVHCLSNSASRAPEDIK
jgi:hypothetical protein